MIYNQRRSQNLIFMVNPRRISLQPPTSRDSPVAGPGPVHPAGHEQSPEGARVPNKSPASYRSVPVTQRHRFCLRFRQQFHILSIERKQSDIWSPRVICTRFQKWYFHMWRILTEPLPLLLSSARVGFSPPAKTRGILEGGASPTIDYSIALLYNLYPR